MTMPRSSPSPPSPSTAPSHPSFTSLHNVSAPRHPSITIRPAHDTPADIVTAAELFRAYATWLSLDLSFQDFATELAALPGKYSPARGGCLLLAWVEGEAEAAGVVALRALPGGGEKGQRAELKRLYTSPAARGKGVGGALVREALARACAMGYREILLDTLPRMKGARKLYEAVGFRECERYYDTPLEGTVFLKLRLSGASEVERLLVGDQNADWRHCDEVGIGART